jgi:hypothetical protein
VEVGEASGPQSRVLGGGAGRIQVVKKGRK